jgi:hypothetical protein
MPCHRQHLAPKLAMAVLVAGARLAAQTPLAALPHHEGSMVSLTFQVDRLRECPETEASKQAALYGQRLQSTLDHLLQLVDTGEVLANQFKTERLELAILSDTALARSLAPRIGVHVDHLGVLADLPALGVLQPSHRQREDQPLWRTTAHSIAHLALNRAIPPRVQQTLGYGWLTTGLAHHSEAKAGNGIVDTFVVRETVQLPLLAWRGDWRSAVAQLLAQQQLPSLDELLATERSDFDPAQHVLTLALIDWLSDVAAPITHGNGQVVPQPLVRLVAAAQNGEHSTAALTRILGQDIVAIEQRLHAFVRQRAGKQRPTRAIATVHHQRHPHLAVYVYTSEPIRPRHRKIVQKALAQRHAAHTSGWQRVDKKPLLAVGPVNQAAGFWHGDQLVKKVPRTWPMVAVLEYDPANQPTAYLDCFRRVTNRSDDDGWMLDPGVGFVAHHNAQFVTDADDRYHYLAVPDTPTGSHVGGSEFVHRGRVTWQNGQQAVVGVLTLLSAPKTKTVAAWHATHHQLVDWIVAASSKQTGVTALDAIEDLTLDLCVWGTKRVFHFPKIPDGLTAGR